LKNSEKMKKQLFKSPKTIRLLSILAVVALILVSRVDWGGESGVLAGLADVRDGDSVVIGRQRVRLHGIDAPELAQMCKRDGQSWNCGDAAKLHLSRLIGNHTVECSGVKRDQFDRVLASCRSGERDLNRTMVQDGMAVAFGGIYAQDEAAARKERVGLWAGEFERPQDWRRKNPR
jgi:endonuclease YncB( thermonuclease family)